MPAKPSEPSPAKTCHQFSISFRLDSIPWHSRWRSRNSIVFQENCDKPQTFQKRKAIALNHIWTGQTRRNANHRRSRECVKCQRLDRWGADETDNRRNVACRIACAQPTQMSINHWFDGWNDKLTEIAFDSFQPIPFNYLIVCLRTDGLLAHRKTCLPEISTQKPFVAVVVIIVWCSHFRCLCRHIAEPNGRSKNKRTKFQHCRCCHQR